MSRSQPDPLVLPCAIRPGTDKLRVSECNGKAGPALSFRQNDTTTGINCDIVLDKDSARALFNWLGVWLHTY